MAKSLQIELRYSYGGYPVDVYPTCPVGRNYRTGVESLAIPLGFCHNSKNVFPKAPPDIKPKIFDKKGKLLNYVDIYVNLGSSYPEELAMSVKDGDRLHITLIIAGGVGPIFERGYVLSRGVLRIVFISANRK